MRGETFAVFDLAGDIGSSTSGEQGLYHDGTRHLSRLELRVDETPPLLLGSTVRDVNDLLCVDLTNQTLARPAAGPVGPGTLHVFRSTLLWDGTAQEKVRVTNHALHPVRVTFAFLFAADFADLFEVRGVRRARRGDRLPDEVEEREVRFAYRGLDGVKRTTHLEFWPEPRRLTASRARFDLTLEPQGSASFGVSVTCDQDGGREGSGRRRYWTYEDAAARVDASGPGVRRAGRLSSSSHPLEAWLGRSAADLHMLTVQTPQGLYPHAGLPWLSARFGRDGLLTALQTLWLDPELARGVLAFLAARPSTEPPAGCVLHEARGGEMARLGEVPYGLSYDSIDATPLFVLLAGAYHERTADRAFLEALWPAVEGALSWMRAGGDLDGDGFLEYVPGTRRGTPHQGWRDSPEAVFHWDGRPAEGPIALVEVQAYAYAAYRAAAGAARALGRRERAAELDDAAEALRRRFEDAFWSEEAACYAAALDGSKRQCQVRGSTAGHVLFAGLAAPERAARTAATLLDGQGFSGWGIRTVSAAERRYNPMGYHTGAVWPHDNAIVASGLARYGLGDGTRRLLTGMLEASAAMDLRRLPQLFCGFRRRHGEGPTPQPAACSPYALSAAAPFLMVQACLGLTIDAPARTVSLRAPALPGWLDHVTVTDLQVGEASVDLRVARDGDGAALEVLRREGDLEVVLRDRLT